MTNITGILHLDNGEEHKFTAETGNITFTDRDLTDERAGELFDIMDEIITLA